MARTEDQKPIVCFVNADFLEKIDQACMAAGCGRSQFIRDAVYAELERRGFEVPQSLKAPPSRKGKGGRKPKSLPSPAPKQSR